MSKDKEYVNKAKNFAKDDVLGAKEWKKSKISWLSGAGVIKDAANNLLVTPVRDGGVLVKQLGKKVFGREKVTPLPTQSTDTAERFGVAQSFYNVSKADLAEIQNKTHAMFMLYAVMFLLVILFETVFFETSGMIIVDIVSRLAMPILLGSLCARQGFYNWQVRKRRLDGFREWITNPHEWCTSSTRIVHGDLTGFELKRKTASTITKTIKSLAIIVGVGAATIMLATPAHAASFFSIPDPNKDIWMNMLAMVFPNVGPLSGNDTVTSKAIASAFSALLTCLMTFAAAYMAWGIMYGIVSTAHEGKVMGEKWHQVWAPVRVIMGVGMLTPVIKGYCLAQILVLYVAVWGGSIGNVMWGVYLNAISTPQVDSPSLPQTLDFTRDIAEMSLCWSSLAKASSLASGGGSQYGNLNPSKPLVPLTTPTAKATQIAVENPNCAVNVEFGTTYCYDGGTSFNNVNFYTWDFGVCGKIVYDPRTSPSSTYLGIFNQYFNQYIAAISAQTQGISNSSIVSQGMPTPTTDVVQQAIDNILTVRQDFDKQLVDATQNYNPSTVQINTMLDTYRQIAGDKGWAIAGSYYMITGTIQQRWFEQVGKLPDIQLGDPNKIPNANMVKALFGSTDGTFSTGAGILGQFRDTWNNGSGSAIMSVNSNLNQAASSNKDNWTLNAIIDYAWSLTGLDKVLVRWITIPAKSGAGLSHMMSLGYGLITAGWALLAFTAVASLVTSGGIVGLATKLAVGGNIAGSVVSFIMMVVVGLMAAGIIHAYVLPMIPYIIFFFFTAGMLILVTEGVIAACLFALFHVSFAGRELFEREQMAGYMIMFNILTRIPLAMMGFFLSVAVFEAMIYFMGQTFYPAVASAIGTGSFIGTFVTIVIMAYLHYQIAIRSFSLITHIPDRVQRWFAAQGEGMDEDRHATGHTGFVVGEIRQTVNNMGARGRIAGGGGGRGGGGAGGAPKRPQNVIQGNMPKRNTGGGGGGNIAKRPERG